MARDLIWADSRAGLTAGAVVLALSYWLSPFFGLPRELLLVTGAANVCYGLYSGWLFTRRLRPHAAIVALVLANTTWAIGCFAAAYHFAPTATLFGILHLAGEGLIVGTLAVLEWRARTELARAR